MVKMKAIILVVATLLCSSLASPKLPTRTNVIILGAGMSGIAAADRLEEKDLHDFIILEGKDYVGGRIQRGPAGKRYPLGAGLVNKDGPIWKLAKMLELEMHDDDSDDFVVRNPSKVNVEDIWKKLRLLSVNAKNKAKEMKECRKADTPLRSLLGMVGWKTSSPIYKAVEFHKYDLQNGVPADLLSGSYHRAMGDVVESTVTDAKGLEHVLKYLAKPFKDRIIFNTVVSEIWDSGSGVTVKTSDGRVYKANHVLVTFSPGVLISERIKFHPTLPKWKRDAFHLRPMSYQCKIYLQFPLRFWDSTNHIVQTGKGFGDLTHWNYFDKSNNISMYRTLLLQLNGDQCLESEQKSDSEVTETAMKTLKEMYGDNIPSPIGIIRSEWNKNNMTFGSQSYPVVGFTSKDLRKLQAPVGRIWFAGEYISNEVGSIASAYNSGRETSKNIADCIEDNLCPVSQLQC